MRNLLDGFGWVNKQIIRWEYEKRAQNLFRELLKFIIKVQRNNYVFVSKGDWELIYAAERY